MMRTAFKMEYMDTVDERSQVELIPFSDIYKEQYRRIYNECYHEMREALDISPYDFIQDDSFFDDHMADVFLLTDDDGTEIIGSVFLNGNEIDDLIVNVRYQHSGYGRQILLWAIEHMRTESIVLHVAQWNERAVRLYGNNGFAVTEEIHF